jgi:hypothetical protein
LRARRDLRAHDQLQRLAGQDPIAADLDRRYGEELGLADVEARRLTIDADQFRCRVGLEQELITAVSEATP